VDLADNVSGATISLAMNAGGGFRVSTIVLLTTDEADQATKKVASVDYHSPGSRKP
jgi:hypothetical protein